MHLLTLFHLSATVVRDEANSSNEPENNDEQEQIRIARALLNYRLRRRWQWPIIPMLRHSPRSFLGSQRESLLLANLPSPATRRSSLYSALNQIQDADQSHQHLLMEHLKRLYGPWKALIRSQDFQRQRQPPMCQLGTTVCLAIAWLLQSQSGLPFLCSLLHLSHLLLHALSSSSSNFLLS